MPAVVNAGDLLVCIFANLSATSVNAPAGWVRVGNLPYGSVLNQTHLWKLAAGTEAGTTPDFVTDGAAKAVAHVYRVSGWWGIADFAPGVPGEGYDAAGTSGLSAAPDPPNCDPTHWGVEDTLWIAAYAADGRETVSGYPLDFLGSVYNESDAGASAISMTSCNRGEAVASLNPTAFAIANPQEWVACTIALRPPVDTSEVKGYQLSSKVAQRYPWDAEG